jgi:MinD superfamily P-loop ATPase
MILPVINWELCQNCNPCHARLACNTRAIVKIELDELPYIEPTRCNGCAKCVRSCSYAAILIDNRKGIA